MLCLVLQNAFNYPTTFICCRKVGTHGNVYEGQVRSSIYGLRPCVVKFSAISEQAIKEADILTSLGSHTNLISIIQSGTYCDAFEDRVYVALDKCHNENLRQYLANRKSEGLDYDLNQAFDFAKQIIAGVTYIHENNVIHLDLKPSNILISQNIHLIKIADFGLSVRVKSPKSKIIHKRQFGTNGYRPLESFGNGQVSQGSDIFSLGAVLFHVLSNGSDVYGRDEHAYIHNVKYGIVNTSGLLVSNPVVMEHLIKCMLNGDRCRRPNIWQVSDHPCWNGSELDCDHEYFADDEIEECAVSSNEDTSCKTPMPQAYLQRPIEFRSVMRKMGFNRKPTIAVFDRVTRYLFCVHDNSVNEMRPMSDHMIMGTFRAISFREHIYVFMEDGSVYSLEYCDVTAKWVRMADGIGRHGDWPQAIASTDGILLVGGADNAFTKDVSKFYPRHNRWEKLKEKPEASSNSALLISEGFLFCFGGSNMYSRSLDKVDKMNLLTMEWTQLTSMSQKRQGAASVECKGLFYVVGGVEIDERLNTVEAYYPKDDQWTTLKSTFIGRAFFRCYDIGGNLFAVIGDNYPQTIEKYNTETDEWEIAMELKGLHVHDSVLIRVSK